MLNDNLLLQANTIYQQMFKSDDSVKWPTITLSDIADITMGQSPSGSTYNEDGIGTIFFQGRAEFGFRFPSVRLYTTEPKRMARRNDILMSVRAPVGDINMAVEDCCIGRGLCAISTKTKSPSYLLYTIYSLHQSFDIFNGEGTVFGSINKDSLYKMPIKQAPKSLIEQFEQIVNPMDNIIRLNCDEICHLEQLRNTILPKLMSGEMNVDNICI